MRQAGRTARAGHGGRYLNAGQKTINEIRDRERHGSPPGRRGRRGGRSCRVTCQGQTWGRRGGRRKRYPPFPEADDKLKRGWEGGKEGVRAAPGQGQTMREGGAPAPTPPSESQIGLEKGEAALVTCWATKSGNTAQGTVAEHGGSPQTRPATAMLLPTPTGVRRGTSGSGQGRPGWGGVLHASLHRPQVPCRQGGRCGGRGAPGPALQLHPAHSLHKLLPSRKPGGQPPTPQGTGDRQKAPQDGVRHSLRHCDPQSPTSEVAEPGRGRSTMIFKRSRQFIAWTGASALACSGPGGPPCACSHAL